MSQPPLDSTPVDTKTTNAKTSHLDSTAVGTKTPDPKALTQPQETSKCKGKEHVQEELESDPSFPN